MAKPYESQRVHETEDDLKNRHSTVKVFDTHRLNETENDLPQRPQMSDKQNNNQI